MNEFYQRTQAYINVNKTLLVTKYRDFMNIHISL